MVVRSQLDRANSSVVQQASRSVVEHGGREGASYWVSGQLAHWRSPTVAYKPTSTSIKSPARTQKYKQLCHSLGLKGQLIGRAAPARWLSLRKPAERLVRDIRSLVSYFDTASTCISSLLTDLPTLLAAYGLLPILRSLNRLNRLCQSRAIFVEDLMQEVALTANKITAMYSGPSPFSALDFPELTAFTNLWPFGIAAVGSGSMTVQLDEADSDSEEPVQLYAIPPKGRRAALVPASDFQQHVDSASAAANPAKETTKLWRYLAGQPITKADILEWEDGQRFERDLERTDRWQVHAADEVHVTVLDCAGEPVTVKLKQQPHALTARRMGVGACVWEGEMLLAAWLAAQPRHRFQGCRCVELGSGPGLAGLLVAKLGGIVSGGQGAYITDKEVVLGLAEANVQFNGLSKDQRRGATCGWAEVSALEWGASGWQQAAASLAAQPLDFILAADCVYIDQVDHGPCTRALHMHPALALTAAASHLTHHAQDGSSPSTPLFIETCAILAASPGRPRCLVSFELRSQAVKEVFLEEAGRAFAKVVRIPSSQLPRGCQVAHIELYELSL
ncbi:hypothetical protein QJQ45_026231 [Haematococcus lacustris]|nr:hypothetical protein QJQ45_026231 [Haematococcus lacustris]